MDYVQNIRESGLNIYDAIEPSDASLWIPTAYLETILDDQLRGFSTAGLPNRTRSKVIKQQLCLALGYPIPKSFKKTHPRFVGQDFDVYVQKSNNLQIWNEEISAARRYVLIRVSSHDEVEKVRVITGETLAKWDRTGTLTQKYQARLDIDTLSTGRVIPTDTDNLKRVLTKPKTESSEINDRGGKFASSIYPPSSGSLLPIVILEAMLRPLVGHQFPDAGHDQERNRGAALHNLICQQLGYNSCPDDGRFPDIQHQLLEIKLQTSPTIDLGLIRPNDQGFLDLPPINGINLRYCDVRYAIFFGSSDGQKILLTHFFLTAGEQFFTRFPQFQGNVVNAKIQIPLPTDLFN